MANAGEGGPYGDSASERSETPISASSGASSGDLRGRKPAAPAQNRPTAAMPNPIWVPAIDTGQRNACAKSPSGTSAAVARASASLPRGSKGRLSTRSV